MTGFIDILLHLDQHLSVFISHYGLLVYFILFVIIFCETGLVVLPFLPGDSLLFITGALAATGSIQILPIFIIFSLAAILGDTVNYSIGHLLKDKVIARNKIRFIKSEHIEHADKFFKIHGGKTIILARFIPFIRTFAPFVAGVGAMSYRRFLIFNVAGGIFWVFVVLFSGYFFGNIPIIKNNFSLLILGVIAITLISVIITLFINKVKVKNKASQKEQSI